MCPDQSKLRSTSRSENPPACAMRAESDCDPFNSSAAQKVRALNFARAGSLTRDPLAFFGPPDPAAMRGTFV